MDDFFEDDEPVVQETWIEDNPSPESSFKLIETPVSPVAYILFSTWGM